MRQTQCFGESTTTRGRTRPRLSFSFIFKNRFCLAVHQSLPCCSAGGPHCLSSCPSEQSLGCASAAEVIVPDTVSEWGGGGGQSMTVPFSAFVCDYRPELEMRVCMHTRPTSRQSIRKQSHTAGSGQAAHILRTAFCREPTS